MVVLGSFLVLFFFGVCCGKSVCGVFGCYKNVGVI